MAWCKVSSLTAATSRALANARFPLTRASILAVASGKVVEGWEIDYFLGKALRRKSYPDLRSVMADLDTWLEAQG
jgi:hypothetical protein